MKTTLFALFLSYCFQVTGQSTSISISEVSKGKAFSFPIIASNNKSVEFKINTYLQLAELKLLKGHEKEDIFEKITIDNGNIYGGKVSIQHSILQNTSNILAVKLTESSCGATCAYWVRYYNFNPQNGDRYFIQDFFNPKEYKTFKKIIAFERRKNLLKQVTEKDSLFTSHMLYAINEDVLEDFYFTTDSIYFDDANLVHKNDMFRGINHLTGIAIHEIKHLLNEFGNAVLITTKRLGDFYSSQETQLYQGTINNQHKVVLLFRNSYDNEYLGVYSYLKYGKGILLEGQLNDQSYFFEEENEQGETTAEITFSRQNKTIVGKWCNMDGTRKLSFTARRIK